MPGAALPSNAAEDPNRFEPNGSVEADAGIVRKRDAGEDSPIAARRKPVEQRLVERTTYSPTSALLRDVDARLGRPAVRRSRRKWMCVRVPHNVPIDHSDEPRVRAERGGDPLRHLCCGRSHGLERDDGVRDVRRIDRRARRRIDFRGSPYAYVGFATSARHLDKYMLIELWAARHGSTRMRSRRPDCESPAEAAGAPSHLRLSPASWVSHLWRYTDWSRTRTSSKTS